MAGKVSELAVDCIEPIVKSLGYELVEVSYKKCFDGMNMEVVIDAENPITLDDCEKVHRAIDAPLDEIDPTNGKPYILSVASPGLDRPLKTERDFKRNLENEVEIVLYEKQDGKKVFNGKLKKFDENMVEIEVLGKNKSFDKSKISTINPVINI